MIPKCLPKDRKMDFRDLERFDQLESVYSGLLEPIESKTNLVEPNEIDLLIVPGMAFEKEGFRMGVGGGYYDRFLQSFKGNTVVPCISGANCSNLPKEAS